ncbi:HEAT repeat domain-containing protein [Amycolatopsis sp., V23-08]|uniref:HEAT repeat domain-containing protein n=1 Tax=Amycolatopsis heterodermiae TaxID=3110235 RepID=A0ABU5RD51_9PSEU|nr:HEAT repeat domain-containing protein [Amycolatopsis sp., V23-08]MEA5364172.1 HEAT repeat domain-containing protein [Amycolatopsis sp., V23-08]
MLHLLTRPEERKTKPGDGKREEIVSGDLRRVAVQALVECWPSTPETHDVLRTLAVRDREPTLRLAAVMALGSYTAVEDDVITLIVRLTGAHHSDDIRVAAIAALGSIRPVTDSALSRLKELTNGEDKASIRRAATSALATAESTEIVEA